MNQFTWSDRWSRGRPLSEERSDPGAAVGSDGRIYAIGGEDLGGDSVASVEALRVGNIPAAPGMTVLGIEVRALTTLAPTTLTIDPASDWLRQRTSEVEPFEPINDADSHLSRIAVSW